VSAICGVLVAGLLVPAVALTGTTTSNSINFFDNLPGELKIDAPAQSTKVLANDGSVLASFFAENRVDVGLNEMSPFIKEGIVAIEDSRFYEHGGVDTTGILRALAATAQGGRQGASTITQQYVNNVIIESQVSSGNSDQVKLGNDKTVGDKIREMKLAIAMEKKYSKDDILKGYLNIVYFNNNVYGIEAAANFYFGVHAKDLTLPQAATLAGVVNSPAYYDPITQPQHATDRRNTVLDKLLSTGKISKADHDAAVKTPLTLNIQKTTQGCVSAKMAPYFCDYIQRLILNNPAYGADPAARERFLYQDGLTIQTTLDPKLQQVAQDQVNSTVPATDPSQRNASLVSVEPGTGKILTMAQNTNYNPAAAPGNTQLNFNVPMKDAKGQPLDGTGGVQIGSTMKPFVFAAWLDAGKSMSTELDGAQRLYTTNTPWMNTCGPKPQGTYDPALGQTLLPNDDANHYYRMSVLQGLYQSINTITFQSALQLDFCKIQQMATAAGVTQGKPIDGNPAAPYDVSQISSLIGTNEIAPVTMANAFATFAAKGVECNPIALVSVTDYQGKKYPVPTADCKQSIRPEVAAGVTYALKQVLTKGSGYNIPVNKNSYDVFAKTGTTDGNTQTWVVGGTSGVVTASWFGNYQGYGADWFNQNVTINGRFWPNVDGADLAGTQWANLMNAAAPQFSTAPFPQPPASMIGAPVRTIPAQPSTPSNNGNTNNGNGNGNNGNNKGTGNNGNGNG
jgi:membrane peptidoglycan carboxypeptidase